MIRINPSGARLALSPSPDEHVAAFERAQRVISRLSDVLASTAPFEELLDRVTASATELTGATGAVVELVDGEELEYVAASGTVGPFRGMRLARGTSLSGRCVASGELQYAADTEVDPRVDRVACAKVGARSMMVVPLTHDGGAIGVLKVVSNRPDAFDSMDGHALRLTAGLVSATWARQRSQELHQSLTDRFAAYSARMASAVAASPTAMMIHDLDGIIEVWNPAAEALIGWTAQECIGRFPPHLSSAEVEQFNELTQKVLWSGSRQTVLRSRVDRAGRPLHLRVSAAPVTDAGGAIIAIVRTFEDITAELSLAAAQSAIAERVRRVIERCLDAFISMDAAGRITEWNPSAERLFGWTRHEALGRPLESLIVPDTQRGGHQFAVDRCMITGASQLVGRRIEVIAKRKDGALVPIEISVTASRLDGEVVFDAFASDISERRAERDSLRSQALMDELTGLPNRAWFNTHVAGAFDRHRSRSNELAVVFVDLDGFKPVNDTFGHAVGDEVLKAVAASMSRSVRASDSVARLSGDEFVIVLEDMVDARANVERVAAKVLQALSRPIPTSEGPVTIGASLGIAVLKPDEHSVTELIRRADRAMYQVKKQGGGSWKLASD